MVGCATVGSINRNFESVNYSDGINKEEAKFIAQKYCIDNRDKCRGYDISSAKVSDGDTERSLEYFKGKWIVHFDRLFTVLYIEVDKKTGKVVSCGQDGI